MINLKSDEEIKIMIEGGEKLKKAVGELLKKIEIGITTRHIDKLAEDLILKEGGKPSFKKVKGYYWTTCLCVNDQIVHTPPSERKLRENDILTLDIGMFYKNFHTDFATTFVIGNSTDDKKTKFLDTGKEALKKAISEARVGRRLGNISEAIEDTVVGEGYHIIKDLTGHGIGHELHEDPYVFGFRERPTGKTIPIKSGLVIAIEVIYSMGTSEMTYEKEQKWSIVTKDGSLSACFEHTVAITEDETIILT